MYDKHVWAIYGQRANCKNDTLSIRVKTARLKIRTATMRLVVLEVTLRLIDSKMYVLRNVHRRLSQVLICCKRLHSLLYIELQLERTEKYYIGLYSLHYMHLACSCFFFMFFVRIFTVYT